MLHPQYPHTMVTFKHTHPSPAHLYGTHQGPVPPLQPYNSPPPYSTHYPHHTSTTPPHRPHEHYTGITPTSLTLPTFTHTINNTLLPSTQSPKPTTHSQPPLPHHTTDAPTFAIPHTHYRGTHEVAATQDTSQGESAGDAIGRDLRGLRTAHI